MRVHVDVAFDAFLSHVSPAVARHPLPLALRTLVLAETALLALIRSQAFALWSRLQWKRTHSAHGSRILVLVYGLEQGALPCSSGRGLAPKTKSCSFEAKKGEKPLF